MFKRESGDWVRYRQLPDLIEVDFHWGYERGPRDYSKQMSEVWEKALNALVDAQRSGKKYVLFTHGSSTSHIGKTTARSQVRNVLRSKEATPYVIRVECIQHDSVFVAAIRHPLT